MKSKNLTKMMKELNELLSLSEESMNEVNAHLICAEFISEINKAIERDHKGLLRKELAEMIGVSASHMTQIFRGDKLFNFKMLAKIEQALNIKFKVKAIPQDSAALFNWNQPEYKDALLLYTEYRDTIAEKAKAMPAPKTNVRQIKVIEC